MKTTKCLLVLVVMLAGSSVALAAGSDSYGQPAIVVNNLSNGDYKPGEICGAYASGVPQVPGTVLCQGHNPQYSCPPGFRRIGGDFTKGANRYWYTCVKN